MKKHIGKVRRWLIHKLGGCAPDDVPPISVTYKTVPLERLLGVFTGYREVGELSNEYVENKIARIIAQGIKPKIVKKYNQLTRCYTYEGSIMLPMEYVRGKGDSE